MPTEGCSGLDISNRLVNVRSRTDTVSGMIVKGDVFAH